MYVLAQPVATSTLLFGDVRRKKQQAPVGPLLACLGVVVLMVTFQGMLVQVMQLCSL